MSGRGVTARGGSTRGAPRTLDDVRHAAEAFLGEHAREEYRALAGLEREPDLQGIYARHARALDDEALALVRDTWRDASSDDERRPAALLLEWLAEAHASRALAALDERLLRWEATASLRTDDGATIAYQRAAIEMANAIDRSRRLEIERARNALVAAELAPQRRERLLRERETVESLGLADGYVATFVALTGIDLHALAAECRTFLADTADMWRDVARPLFRARLGVAPGEATRADALHLFRLGGFDAGFPGRDLEPAVRRQVAEMGIDPDAGGRITFDTAEREGKRARAFCAPVRVPDEVYLVLRPFGGQQDWATLLHELGHALHFAYMQPDLPVEARWMGDNSVTEGWAMLLDHLMHDAGWLRRYTALDGARVDEFRRAAAIGELHILRRYAAKLLYELELHAGGPAPAMGERYVELLGDATLFRYDVADAYVDVDPRFYAARYLRAWQLQAVVTRTLVEHYDEDWYRNPRAGPWVIDTLFAPGQRERGDEVAGRVAGAPLGFAPLVRSIAAVL